MSVPISQLLLRLCYKQTLNKETGRMEYIRPFVRPVLLISTILGVLLLPVNWSDLPSSHPNTLGRLPESMFTVPTL